jgi:hypothetical protein
MDKEKLERLKKAWDALDVISVLKGWVEEFNVDTDDPKIVEKINELELAIDDLLKDID